jgi:hypothetical protein
MARQHERTAACTALSNLRERHPRCPVDVAPMQQRKVFCRRWLDTASNCDRITEPAESPRTKAVAGVGVPTGRACAARSREMAAPEAARSTPVDTPRTHARGTARLLGRRLATG